MPLPVQPAALCQSAGAVSYMDRYVANECCAASGLFSGPDEVKVSSYWDFPGLCLAMRRRKPFLPPDSSAVTAQLRESQDEGMTHNTIQEEHGTSATEQNKAQNLFRTVGSCNLSRPFSVVFHDLVGNF